MLKTRGMDKVLNKWLKNNGFNVSVFLDSDFAYYHTRNKIAYSIVVTDKADRLFYSFCNSLGLKVDCGIFIISFLHELGHYVVGDSIPNIDYLFSEDIKTILGTTDKDYEIYFSLPCELPATEWAIEYANTHPQEIEELAINFQKEMKKFLDKYTIEVV